MSGYAELDPRPSLAGRVSCVWTSTAPPVPTVKRIVPDGCVDLIWTSHLDAIQVAGPDTTAYLSTLRPGERFAGVRFRPGAGAAVLGVPLHTLRNERVTLADLWGSDVADRLTDRVHDANGDVRVFEALVAGRIQAAGAVDPLVSAVVARARCGVPVGAVADELGTSERRLRRRCHDAFGYGPKVLQRILRFHDVLAHAPTSSSWSELAYRHGYADQAHLAREVRTLSGVALSALVPQRRP